MFNEGERQLLCLSTKHSEKGIEKIFRYTYEVQGFRFSRLVAHNIFFLLPDSIFRHNETQSWLRGSIFQEVGPQEEIGTNIGICT